MGEFYDAEVGRKRKWTYILVAERMASCMMGIREPPPKTMTSRMSDNVEATPAGEVAAASSAAWRMRGTLATRSAHIASNSDLETFTRRSRPL